VFCDPLNYCWLVGTVLIRFFTSTTSLVFVIVGTYISHIQAVAVNWRHRNSMLHLHCNFMCFVIKRTSKFSGLPLPCVIMPNVGSNAVETEMKILYHSSSVIFSLEDWIKTWHCALICMKRAEFFCPTAGLALGTDWEQFWMDPRITTKVCRVTLALTPWKVRGPSTIAEE